jgi:hypothetical protein
MKFFPFHQRRLQAVMFFLLVACCYGKGQETYQEDFTSDPAYISPISTEKSDPNILTTPEIKKVSFSFTTGMVFGSAIQHNYFATAFIAPAIAYNISPRLRVRAGGLIFFNSFYKPLNASSQPGALSTNPLNHVALFVAADYFITDRLTFTGTYYKIPENDLFQPKMTPEVIIRYQPYYSLPSESMSLGLNYKITKGFSIGAEVRFSNNYQPSLSPYPCGPGYPQNNPVYW